MFRVQQRRRNAWDVFVKLPLWALAFLWRTLLFRTTFIAVTGSLGKTTAKDCLGAILSTAGPTAKTEGNRNGRDGIPLTLLSVRPWHRYAVVETGTSTIGGLAHASLLVRPQVAVILTVARTHQREFRNLDNTAREKAGILRYLRRRGAAVLNGSDERVAGMAKQVSGRVVTFGVDGTHDVVAQNIRSSWPDRLSFTVVAGERRAKVRTQLVGVHWTNSVLGAIAAATACGVELGTAADAVSAVAPYMERMQPAPLPNGAVILRDSFNGSIDSLLSAVEVLRSAKASRRILVISDCSDDRRKPRQRLQHYARIAAEVSEAVVFVGERNTYGAEQAVLAGMPEHNVHACFSLADAAKLLRRELQPGDLVLIRGTNKDHFARLYFSLIGTVQCTMTSCRIQRPCDECPKLGFQPDAEFVKLSQGKSTPDASMPRQQYNRAINQHEDR